MLQPKEYVLNALRRLDEYLTGITSNTITANQYEKLAVKRFNDFRSQDYLYREDELKRILKFFSLVNININNAVIQYPIAGHEIFWLANIYGLWKDKNTRLFDQSYISISKGNNKSTFSSICALYSSVGQDVIDAHIIAVASTKDQARQLIDIMEKIINNSPILTDLFKINRNIIINKTSSSKNRIEIKSSDVGGIHGVGAGLVLAICDEFAQFKNSELQTILKSAQEAKTVNHHQLIITHATSNKFESPAYELQEVCQNILKGTVQADNVFTQIFTLDDLSEADNPEMWRKSNPMLGLSVPKENLLTSYENAKIFPDKMNTFKTYNLNLWIDDETDGENWIVDDVIKENMQDFEFSTANTITCAVDLSHQRDLSCCGWIQHNPIEDKFYADVQFFFPNNERNRIKEHGSIDLSRWFITKDNPDNYILRSDMPVLNHQQVIDFIKGLDERIPIDTIGFDKFHAQQIEYKLQSTLGIDVTNIEMNWKLTTAIAFVERLLLTNRLIMKRNPVLRWNFQNCIIHQSDNNNLYLRKRNKEAIDGVISIVIAFAVWIDNNFTKHQIMIDGFDKIYNRDLKKAG